MIVDFVSRFIEETRGHPLDVTVPEAQLLHDFATWVDSQSTQQSVSADQAICRCNVPAQWAGTVSNYCAKCDKPLVG